MKASAASQGQSASKLISKRIADLGDWRGDALSRMRALIKEADPEVVEEWKWMSTPVWSHDGIICTGESYQRVVKLTFAEGAPLKDPARLFNANLDGNVRRAIDIHVHRYGWYRNHPGRWPSSCRSTSSSFYKRRLWSPAGLFSCPERHAERPVAAS